MSQKYKDIAGMVFGKWTVLERIGSTTMGIATWKCRCSCGTERILKGAELRRGKTKSCGCDYTGPSTKPEEIDVHKQLFSGNLYGNIGVHSVLSEAEWAWCCSNE